MISRIASPVRRVRGPRAGFESYLGRVQKPNCASGPSYDEARKDFNGRLRGELRGYLG